MHSIPNRLNLWIILLLLLIPGLVFADAGLPMIMAFPAVLVALVPVILIETFVFRRYIRESLGQSFRAVAVANVVSTLLGYPLAWMFLFAIEFGSSAVYSRFLESHPGLSWSEPTLITQIFWVILQSAWLTPIESELYWMIPVAGAINLLVAFFVSVYLEYWVTKKFFKSCDPQLLKKVSWRANLASYGVLISVLLVWLVYGLATHGPRTNSSVKNVSWLTCTSQPDNTHIRYELTLNSENRGQLIERQNENVLQVASLFFDTHNSTVNDVTKELDELEFKGGTNSLNIHLESKRQTPEGRTLYQATLNAEGRTVANELKRYNSILECEIFDINAYKP